MNHTTSIPSTPTSAADAHRRQWLQHAAATACGVALWGCQTPPPRSTPAPNARAVLTIQEATAELDAWLTRRWKRQSHSNLSIAVLHQDHVVWSKGMGWAQPDQRIPATPHTRYRAGSISKVFTTVAVMRLAEEGLIHLDAPLQHALPRFDIQSRFAPGQYVTPRQILQHRSGLPSDLADGMWTHEPVTLMELVENLRNEHMAFAPNQIQSYSNLGFSVLGAAIEHLTGQPFAQWMQNNVLAPLGMQHSAFEIHAPSGPSAALSLNSKGHVQPELGLRDSPAGGLNTTVIDLLQLARMWCSMHAPDTTHLLSRESMMAMQTPLADPAPTDIASVGLGWHLLDEESEVVGPLLWHSGGTLHHRAELMVLPQQRLGVAVMSSTEDAGEMAHEVALQALRLLSTATTGHPARPPHKPMVDAQHPPQPLASFVGQYDTPMGIVHLIEKDRHLEATMMSKRFRLRPQLNGYLRLEYKILGLFPVNLGRLSEMEFTQHTLNDGTATILVRRNGRFVIAGTRLDPTPLPETWRSRLGTYLYAGSDPLLAQQMPQVILKESHGLLLAELSLDEGPTQLALEPLNDQLAVIRGLGRNRRDTVVASTSGSGDIQLMASGMRFFKSTKH